MIGRCRPRDAWVGLVYEEIAPIFISGRGRNSKGVGASAVADWSRMLPDRATVLDLGCETGVPISQL